MEIGILTIVAVVGLAVCGFIFLATALMAVWKSLSSRKGSLLSSPVNSKPIEDPISPEDCYDDCMKAYDWRSEHARSCAIACKL